MTTLHRERETDREERTGEVKEKKGEMDEIGKRFEIVRGHSCAYFAEEKKKTPRGWDRDLEEN